MVFTADDDTSKVHEGRDNSEYYYLYLLGNWCTAPSTQDFPNRGIGCPNL